MIPLETNQLMLMWLYAFPPDENATKWKKVAYSMFTASVIGVNFLCVTSNGFFIAKFVSSNLEEALFALSHVIVFFNSFYQSVVTVILRHKLQEIFKSLSKIYDESKNNKFCCFHF